ncbi:MAG: hypothetical protein WBL28_01500 [Methylotenera sp.]
MKIWPLAVFLTANALLANISHADEAQAVPLINEIPTEEKAFVDVINQFDKTKIVELLGEPAKADDVRIKGSDKVVASIWQYHNINTDANGAYYPTTELDFIDDKVVMVVFMNHDGSESSKNNQTYENPQLEQNQIDPGM